MNATPINQLKQIAINWDVAMNKGLSQLDVFKLFVVQFERGTVISDNISFSDEWQGGGGRGCQKGGWTTTTPIKVPGFHQGWGGGRGPSAAHKQERGGGGQKGGKISTTITPPPPLPPPQFQGVTRGRRKTTI